MDAPTGAHELAICVHMSGRFLRRRKKIWDLEKWIDVIFQFTDPELFVPECTRRRVHMSWQFMCIHRGAFEGAANNIRDLENLTAKISYFAVSDFAFQMRLPTGAHELSIYVPLLP